MNRGAIWNPWSVSDSLCVAINAAEKAHGAGVDCHKLFVIGYDKAVAVDGKVAST
jgi:hypothetical protein